MAAESAGASPAGDAPAPETPVDAHPTKKRGAVRTVITVMLATIPVLLAFTAWQSSQYADESAALGATAARLSVESIRAGQRDHVLHLQDILLWLRLQDTDPEAAEDVKALMSASFQDAIGRQEAQELTGLPMDDRYWNELEISADATAHDLSFIYAQSRLAGATAARQTGATVVYSAAILLLTVASGIKGNRRRWWLCVGAGLLVAVGLAIGWAPVLIVF